MSTQTIFKTVGQTSQSVDLSLVQNAASAAAGDPVLGLAFNTSLLVAWYRIPPAGTLTSISLVTQTVGGAFSSGGFVKISDANAPGQYRFDIPNACLASAGECNITFSGFPAGTAGNMETHTLKIIVTTFDLNTAAAAVPTVAQILTTQMTESYAADGSAPTLAQALFQIQQFQQEKNVSGAAMTVKKLDGSTTAFSLTMNDTANASAITRSG